MAAFKAGSSIKPTVRVAKRPEVFKEVPFLDVVTVTEKAVLFTFEVMDRKRQKLLVDRWLPKKYLEVDEEGRVVRMPKWLYEKEWGHEYG